MNINKNKIIFIISAIVVLLSLSQPQLPAASRGRLIERKIDNVTVLVYVPGDYTVERKYPLIVGCHGAGQSGEEIYNAWREAADKRGYIIAAPNFEDYYKQKGLRLDVFLLDVVKEMRSTYRIDRSRIVLVGNSRGARYSYLVGLVYSNVFSAIAPCSGNSSYLDGFPWRKSVKKIPVYVLHGELDPYFPLDEMYKEEKELKRYGYKVKVHVNKGVGHAYPNALETPVPDWIDRHFK
ncbi:MAG: dienelactone hydrolase family protein [Candidatus Omnitrophota bacterium]